MKKIVLILLTALVCSCGIRRSDLSFTLMPHLTRMNVSGGKIDAGISMGVKNDSRRTLTIRSAELSLHDNAQRRIAQMTLKAPIIFASRQTSEVTADVTCRVSGLFGMLSIMSQLSVPETITVNGEVRVSVGAMSKKFRVKNMPLDQFLSKFDIDLQQILNSIQE